MHCHLDFYDDAKLAATTLNSLGVYPLGMTVDPRDYQHLASDLAGLVNANVALGLHPWWIAEGKCSENELELFCELTPNVRYIGEIGLDFAPSRVDSKDRQIHFLDRMLAAASTETLATSAHSTSLRSTSSHSSTATTSAYSATTSAHSACLGATSSHSSTAIATSALSAATTSAHSTLSDTTADTFAHSKPKKIYSFHSYNAEEATLDLIEKYELATNAAVILHWYAGSHEQLVRAVNLGCYFSVNDKMLRSKRTHEYLKCIPKQKLLLETDLPVQGTSAHVANAQAQSLEKCVAAIAEILGADYTELAKIVACNSAHILI